MRHHKKRERKLVEGRRRAIDLSIGNRKYEQKKKKKRGLRFENFRTYGLTDKISRTGGHITKFQ